MFKRHLSEFWRQVTDLWRQTSAYIAALWFLTRILARKAKREAQRKLKPIKIAARAWAAKKVRSIGSGIRRAALVVWSHVRKRLRLVVLVLVCLACIWFLGAQALENTKLAAISTLDWLRPFFNSAASTLELATTSLWNWVWQILIYGGVATLAIALAIWAVKKIRRARKTGTGTKPGGKTLGERWTEWNETLAGIREGFKNSWILTPIIVFAVWGVITWVLVLPFFPEHFNWIWGDQPLYWAIPSVVCLAIIFYKFGGFAVNIGTSIALVLLLVATINSYRESAVWRNYRAVANAENAKEKAEREQATRDTYDKEVTVYAPQGDWTEFQTIPDGWRKWIKPDGKVEAIVQDYQGREKKITDGPNQLADYGTEKSTKVKWKSLENRDVKVVITVTRRY